MASLKKRNLTYYLVFKQTIGDRHQEYGITAMELATRFRKYEIRPKQMRIDDGDSLKGYEHWSFEDAFERYLPAEEQTQNGDASQPKQGEQTENYSKVARLAGDGPLPAVIGAIRASSRA